MQFEQSMVGKRVREKDTGDEGTVLSRRMYKDSDFPLPGYRVAVKWDNTGEDLSICLDEVDFIDPVNTLEEITINGKRYKLVPIEEE